MIKSDINPNKNIETIAYKVDIWENKIYIDRSPKSKKAQKAPDKKDSNAIRFLCFIALSFKY